MKKAMSSKERVLTTFARQAADRVPVNYFSNYGIDQRLKQYFKLALDDKEGLNQALGVDFRTVGVGYVGPKLHETRPGIIADEWGKRRRWVEHESGGYWDFCEWPLQFATMEDVENWPLPSPDDYDYTTVAERCKKYRDYCVVAGGAGCGDIINSTSMLRNMEQVLIDLLTDDPVGLRFIQRTQDTLLEIMTRVLEAGNGLFDVFWIGEDLGTQRGPIIGLDLFRKHIRPRLQKFVDLAKSWNLPVVVHSCGSSSWAFNDFIEMGIDVVDTLQPEAKNMEPAYLKQTYSDRLAFHGMISTAGPVANGTVEDVVRDVRQTLEIMMPGGGYALAPTHALQDNSPTENVVAMFRAARELGVY
jgi:uroporphyrinogen-III decarboxylase